MADNEDAPKTLRMTVFDGALSARGYHINKFAKSLTTPAGRDAYAADRSWNHGRLRIDGGRRWPWWRRRTGRACSTAGPPSTCLPRSPSPQGGTLMHIGAQMRGQIAGCLHGGPPGRAGPPPGQRAEMGRIIGGIGCSHAPALAGVHDSGGQDKPLWKPIFDGFAASPRSGSRQRQPDVVLIAYNDHLNHFFFDSYPTFALGVAEQIPPGG